MLGIYDGTEEEKNHKEEEEEERTIKVTLCEQQQ